MEMVTLTPNMTVHGKSHPLLKLHQSPPLKTQSTQMNFHSRPSLEQEENTIDPKHSNITMEMVTLTPNTMDNGKSHPLLRLPQSLLLKTQSTPMSFHLKPSLEPEESMTDPKLSNTTMETVMSTPNTMDNGKFHPSLRLLQS